MTYGLRVWDANGLMTLDISTRLFRIVQRGAITVGELQSVNIPVAGMQNDGNWVVHINYDSWEDPSFVVINAGYFTIANKWLQRLISYTVYTL